MHTDSLHDRSASSFVKGGSETALATAVLIAGATQAYGDRIRYDNDGTFHWFQNVLDIRKPVDQQPGIIGGASTIYQDYFGDSYPTFSYQHTYTTGGGAEIFAGGFSNRYAKPLESETLISAALTDGAFGQFVTFEFAFTACDYYNPGDCTSGTRGLLPEGEQTYLGVQFDAGMGTQYGWIGVVRQGAFVSTFAWGYETEPGVPIPAGGIPAPGTLAALAFGAALSSRGRRAINN